MTHSVGAVIGARVFTLGGVTSTDSTSMYEVIDLAAHFDEFCLHAFVVDDGSGRDPVPLGPNVRVIALGRVTNGSQLYLGTFRSFARLLRSARYGGWTHGVIFETGWVSLLALIAFRVAGRPTIAVIRGDASRTTRLVQRYSRGWRRPVGWWTTATHLICQRTLARSVPVVVDSCSMARRIEGWGGEAYLVPAGSIGKSAVVAGKRPWGGPQDGALKLLWVGRFEPVKSLETIVEAVRLLVESGRDVELELVGTGDETYVERIRRMVDGLALTERVRFAGPLPHGPLLFARFRRADVFVLSSLSEGTPKVIPEAFAHGLPVIASRVGDLPALVDDRTGCLFGATDPQGLARAVSDLYDQPWRLAAMSAEAIARAGGLTLERTSALLATLVSTARPPRFTGLAARRRGAQ